MEIINETRNDLLDTDMMLTRFINDINVSNNFCIVRFGDGEFMNIYNTLINGSEKLHNCDHCYYYNPLGRSLKEAYEYFLNRDHLYIMIWLKVHQIEVELNNGLIINNFISNDLILNRYEDLVIHDTLKQQFFKSIIRSNRHKIYVSNINNVRHIAPLLKVNRYVFTPERNAYLYDYRIYNNIIKELEGRENVIILFSIGTYTKYLIYQLHKMFKNKHTFIDLGTSFDGLFKKNRDYNSDNRYHELIKKIYKVKE